MSAGYIENQSFDTDPVGKATELLTLDEALNRLAADYPRESEIMELRYLGGLTVEKTAETLDISPATRNLPGHGEARLGLCPRLAAGGDGARRRERIATLVSNCMIPVGSVVRSYW